MKKAHRKTPEPEMLPEYQFRGGVRGKYAKRYAEGTNLVALAPDVVKEFPDSEAVNEALRACAQIIRGSSKRRRKSTK